jgi:cyclopropane fatty-acyl-phospholipid synthase-like methyltransferase
MSRESFDNFGRLTGADLSWTTMAGRYSFQASAEPRIVADIASKLRLNRNDTLLEIGCGAGNLLIPLADLVRSATGIDHARLLQKLGERSSSIRCIPGNFIDAQIAESFSKILIYSVIHYLADEAEIIEFVTKAAGLLSHGGRMLIGDITNIDKKRAFEASPLGREFLDNWRRNVRPDSGVSIPDSKRVTIDECIIDRLRNHLKSSGFEAARLNQPEDLPFCYTREDMLVSHSTL